MGKYVVRFAFYTDKIVKADSEDEALRLAKQNAFGAFNELNADDDFDVEIISVPKSSCSCGCSKPATITLDMGKLMGEVDNPKSELFNATFIDEVTDEHILFQNGSEITFSHDADCCEWNYADFKQLDDLGRSAPYFINELDFGHVPNAGFSMQDAFGRRHFIPCYSEQNGYYSSDVDIYLDGVAVLNVEAEFMDRDS